jgi:oligosaccharyltransferase complex subunit gamma
LVTITTSLVMTGGLMFVKIRGTPERGHDGSWIAAGFQNQYGQEVQVVAGICKYPLFFLSYTISYV